MAQKAYVHRTSSTTSRFTRKLPVQANLLHHPKKQSWPPKSRNFQLDHVVSVNRSFKDKGFSKQAQQLHTAYWRKGSQKDYFSKFEKFCDCCSTREIDPYSACLTQAADFLSDLFAEGLQYRQKQDIGKCGPQI